MNEQAKFTGVPLEVMGDAIVEAYRQVGHTVGISIIVNSADTGQVTTTSNLPRDNEVHMLKWIVEQREAGNATEETVDVERKLN